MGESEQATSVALSYRDHRRPRNWGGGEESIAVPLFPIGPYTPQSECAHKGPITRGSVFYCPICHDYGREDHISKPLKAAKNRAKPTRYVPPPKGLKGGTG
jgi:hypothetical protein